MLFPFIWITTESDLPRSNPRGFLTPKEAKEDLDRVQAERAAWRQEFAAWVAANPAPVIIEPVRTHYPSLGSVPESDSAHRLREANSKRRAEWHERRQAFLNQMNAKIPAYTANSERIWFRVPIGNVSPEDHLVAHDMEEEAGLTKPD